MSDLEPSAEPAGEIRELFIFTPRGGESWGVTFERFTLELERRHPGEFSLVEEEPEELLPAERSLDFGFTMGDDGLEGFYKDEPEGAALRQATAREAAVFAEWLIDKVVPSGASVAFTTRVSEEYGLDEVVLAHRTAAGIEAQLLTRVEHLIALDRHG